ncbi:MerR family transcriptional regulator [Streptomyces sp. 4F14]|uniref:MerR family transcriptional regulator n=1 Tax=Streptomyces sp. 4F14 TaxID=3394380 RepID=UPI003A83A12A
MDKDPGLTTGTLARRLGVAPTTLRTWDRRYGLGPTARTSGGHRRWTPDDVAAVERMCGLTATGVPPAEAARLAAGRRDGEEAARLAARGRGGEAAPERAAGGCGEETAAHAGHGTTRGPLGDHQATHRERRGLARAALRLDSPSLERQLTAAVEAYGVTTAWEHVIAPVLHAVGRKWASSGERYVEVEHLLSWHVSTALRHRTTPVTGPDPIVLACVPGEQHTLALEALHAGLAELALPVRMFGAAVPVPALTAAVDRLGPSAVVLWAQTRSTANPAPARRIAGARWGVRGARRGPLVVLAGPGWLGRSGEGTVRPGSLRDALGVLSRGRGPA